MKNPIQLLTISDIQDKEVRRAIEGYYEDELTSSDNYLRYYPNKPNSYFDNSFEGIVKEYLLSEGYTIDFNDEYFYILIRWSW